MDTGYITIAIGVLVAGIAYGLLKKKRPGSKKSYAGWAGLVMVAVPLVGLLVASAIGDETLTWAFAIALAFVLPALFLFAIGVALGGFFNRGKDGHRN